MTNTLHRQGTEQSLAHDFIVFALPARGHNTRGSGDKLRQILQIFLKHKPVNMGNLLIGNMQTSSPENIMAETGDGSIALAVFTDSETVTSVLKELKEADLGISINISGLVDEVGHCCRHVGITRHSVEHSLGFWGRTEHLPSQPVLEISTMCGHGMVSFNLVSKMVEYVKLGKLSCSQAARHLAKPCECGAFNPKRAEHLLQALKRLG